MSYSDETVPDHCEGIFKQNLYVDGVNIGHSQPEPAEMGEHGSNPSKSILI